MRRDVHNWNELCTAVEEMAMLEPSEPRVLVLYDPGQQTYHFVFGEHGLMKIASDRRGNELYPERSRRSLFSEGE